MNTLVYRRALVMMIIPMFFAGFSRAQSSSSPEGVWSGSIMGIKLVFHFRAGTSGQLTATMDSPDQGAIGLPIQNVSLTKDSLFCVLTAPPARYVAARTNDSVLTGTWYQHGASLPLVVHRLSAADALALAHPVRPQTPHPPFPYHSDSVEYDNADRTVHLGATLTYPTTGGPFPAAILITGSGTQDRDETIFGHHSFAVIADYLTRRGYAVLRVDDRGAGLSTGELMKATSADFAKDVETSMDWLEKQKEIDPLKIGLIGHSEGAMIAPIVASQRKDVAFIISLAGPADGYSTIRYQGAAATQMAETSDIPWWKFFLAYKAADYYRLVKCPVLALGGGRDVQVHNVTDLPQIDSMLRASGNSHVTTQLMPGLNHLFQHCQSCTGAEYGKLEETFSPEVLGIMGDWLDANVRRDERRPR